MRYVCLWAEIIRIRSTESIEYIEGILDWKVWWFGVTGEVHLIGAVQRQSISMIALIAAKICAVEPWSTATQGSVEFGDENVGAVGSRKLIGIRGRQTVGASVTRDVSESVGIDDDVPAFVIITAAEEGTI